MQIQQRISKFCTVSASALLKVAAESAFTAIAPNEQDCRRFAGGRVNTKTETFLHRSPGSEIYERMTRALFKSTDKKTNNHSKALFTYSAPKHPPRHHRARSRRYIRLHRFTFDNTLEQLAPFGPNGSRFSNFHMAASVPASNNEPGFYLEGQWGIRIESALVVRRLKMRGERTSGGVWLGFERLSVVPIQTKMINESMLTKEEKAWIQDHNQRCLQMLAPFLEDDKDKRAMKYLARKVKRGIGVVTGPGGMSIDWD